MNTPNNNNRSEVKVIVGPTAAGKTDYAIKLARSVGGAVISADSRQVYAGMDIGTGKPQELWGGQVHENLEADSVEGVGHYLFSVVEPNEPITLAAFQEAAGEVIEELLGQGVTPVIAGGTMLYVDSIVRNFSLPAVPPNEAVRAELEALSEEELWARLEQDDPEALEFIQPGQTRRMVRALEVLEVTGKPFSQQRAAQPSPYTFEIIGLFPGWDTLEQRISQRITVMLEAGLIGEVRGLQKKYGADLPLLQTLNYKQAGQVLSGELSEEAARAEMVKENLRYAKRQMKWWRNRYLVDEINWID